MPDKYGTGGDTQYCHPGSDVLINKLGLSDEAALEAAEIKLSLARIEHFNPDFNNISLSALRDIHRFLFQDVYEWACELRSVDISKGSTRFANVSRVEPEAEKLFQQLAQENYLVGLPREQFVARLAHYYCELNVVHPFRDGNGRAQRVLFEVIGANAGYTLDWELISCAEWLEANIAAYNCRLEPLAALLDRVLTPI